MIAPVKEARIVLVDDHPMVRERLREVIEREADLLVCGEAESRNQALAVIEIALPDLVIIDLSLKDSYGLDLIKDIRIRYPRLFMLVVSMHDGVMYAERSIRAGAHGYITKQEATKKILRAIRFVLGGGLYLSDTMAKQIAFQVAGNKNKQGVGMSRLTDRELRVFELIGHGQTLRQIADNLSLDIKTVETYRARIKEKLNLKDATEVLQFAIRWQQGKTPP